MLMRALTRTHSPALSAASPRVLSRFASSSLKKSDPVIDQSVIDTVKASDHEFVKLGFTDVDGIMRGKYISKNKFLSVAESQDRSLGVCNVVFGWDMHDKTYDERVTYTGGHTGYPDALARIQLDTYRTLPWEHEMPFFLLEFHDEGNYLPQCPRSTLRRVLDKADSMGYNVLSGMEFEWFNFKETSESVHDKDHSNLKPLTHGMHGYSALRTSCNRDYFHALMNNNMDMDVILEGVHTETGPGVYEAAIEYSDSMIGGDRATLFKFITKVTAHYHGVTACFMSKPNENLPGSSGHVHQSLVEKDTKNPVFYDDGDKNKMSEVFKQYVAGQVLCLPHILPMYAPNVNSYKRQVPGFWAPLRASWGIDNRTAAIRVLPGSAKSTRLETRIAGADVNPYFNIAASVAAGLYGIENKLTLTDSVEGTDGRDVGDVDSHLPSNLFDAATKMRNSELAKDLFGAEFVDHYTATRLWEWEQWSRAVTDWETKRYLELA